MSSGPAWLLFSGSEEAEALLASITGMIQNLGLAVLNGAVLKQDQQRELKRSHRRGLIQLRGTGEPVELSDRNQAQSLNQKAGQ